MDLRVDPEAVIDSLARHASAGEVARLLQAFSRARFAGRRECEGIAEACHRLAVELRAEAMRAQAREARCFRCMGCGKPRSVAPPSECGTPYDHYRDDLTPYAPFPTGAPSAPHAASVLDEDLAGLPWYRRVSIPNATATVPTVTVLCHWTPPAGQCPEECRGVPVRAVVDVPDPVLGGR